MFFISFHKVNKMFFYFVFFAYAAKGHLLFVKVSKIFFARAANGIFFTAGFSGEEGLSLMPRRALTLQRCKVSKNRLGEQSP